MPNMLEEQLKAVQFSIGAIKRQMNDCVNVAHYELLQRKLNAYEEQRVKLLEQMEVEL